MFSRAKNNYNQILALMDEDIVAEIQVEIKKIVNEEKITIKLHDISLLEKISQQNSNEEIFKQIRFLILAISNRREKINIAPKALKILKSISNKIGIVPTLNSSVHLPDNTYWAKPRTVKKWGETPWYDPSRTNEEEKVTFFTSSQTASVRKQLFSEENASISDDGKKQFMSYCDVTFLPPEELEADHFQGSAIILKRQKELVEAMNLDPLFCEKMLKCGDENYYFIKDDNNGTPRIVGSKNFYMEYHNCIDNLWLIRGASNLGKRPLDCIDYLAKHSTYADFLTTIGGEQSISKTTILWTVNNSNSIYHEMLLAKALRQWFKEQYPLTIEISKRLDKFVMRQAIEKTRELDKMEHGKMETEIETKNHLFAQAMMEGIASREKQTPPRPKRKVGSENNSIDSGYETDSPAPKPKDTGTRVETYKRLMDELGFFKENNLRQLRKGFDLKRRTASSQSENLNSLTKPNENPTVKRTLQEHDLKSTYEDKENEISKKRIKI